MRIWSLHPSYLDTKGLGGLWAECCIAQNALFFERGYYNHPAMDRIKAHPEPEKFIGMYMHQVYREAQKRGFSYNPTLIHDVTPTIPIPVTQGQLYYEWTLLQERLQRRAPEKMIENDAIDIAAIKAHPMFYVVEGGIESWEKIKDV